MTDLSIIVISFNTVDITKRCLETILTSLKHAPFSTEIIVLDNASTDDSVSVINKMASSSSTPIRLIESKENLGFSKGNNVAVKEAKGNYLLFLNSDTEVLDDAISSLYSFMINPENNYSFVGAKLYEKDGMTAQPSAGHFYTLPVVFSALFLRGDYYGLTRSSPDSIRRVDWVSGACFMCKREVFDLVNGFDEGIFMYMEEIDLFYRAWKKKLTVGFYPLARFIHLGSASSKGRTEPIVQVYKGFLYFYKKHHSPLQILILRIMLQLKAILSLGIGVVINNTYLKKTYGQALKIATLD